MARAKVGKATPQQAAQAWNTGFSAGAENARLTVTNNQSKSWSQGTLNAEQAISAGIQQAFTSGRWRQGVQRAGDQTWQQAMLQKGIPHMAAGSAMGQQHYAAFRAQWDPFVQQVVSQLPKRGTFEQNKLRSTGVQDAFHQAKGKFKKLWRGQAGA